MSPTTRRGEAVVAGFRRRLRLCRWEACDSMVTRAALTGTLVALLWEAAAADQIVYESKNTQYDFEIDLGALTWHGIERETATFRITGTRGLASAGTFQVYYSDLVSIEEVKVDVAHADNPGKWMPAELASGDASPDEGSHTDSKIRTYLIPGLRIGDRVRRLTSTRHHRTWELPWYGFGASDSVRQESVEYRIPRSVRVTPRVRPGQLGWPAPQATEAGNGGSRLLRFEARGLPPIPPVDGHSPHWRDLTPSVWIGTACVARGRGDSVQVRGSWAAFAKWYEARLAPALVPDQQTREWMETLHHLSPDREKYIAEVYHAVQTQVRYMAVEVGEGGWLPHPASTTRANGYGDCKDMATLLVAALRHGGVPAYPALVNTRGAGSVDPGLPFSQQFNHCVAYVPDPGGDWWLDATNANALPGEVTDFINENPALILAGDQTRFVRPASRDSTPSEFRQDYRLANMLQDRVAVQFRFEWSGALAGSARDLLKQIEPERRAAVARTILEDVFLAVSDLALEPAVAFGARPAMQGTCTVASPVAVQQDRVLISRGVVRLDLPNVQAGRRTPFELGPERTDRVQITAPWPGAAAARDTAWTTSHAAQFGALQIDFVRRDRTVTCRRSQHWQDTTVPVEGMRAFLAEIDAMRRVNDERVALPGGSLK